MRVVLSSAFLVVALTASCGPGPVCAAVPTCEEGEEQGDACEEGEADCREVTVCESTIHCRPATTDAGS